MWLAETSLSDGIAIVMVATVLFLSLLGTVVFVRWVFRTISGRSALEAVILVFSDAYHGEDDADGNEPWERLKNFVWFLHTKLRENQLGHFVEFSNKGEEMLVIFKGADADQIWQMIHTEAKGKAPEMPLCVILERSKKNGGQRIIDAIAWLPTSFSLPQPELPTIPESWYRLSFHSNILTNLGIGGLVSWGILQKFLKLSENEFRDTVFGNITAWIIGIILIVGLSLKWLSHAKIRSLVKQTGLPTDDSSTSTILKYVLLMVILIFGLVLVLFV